MRSPVVGAVYASEADFRAAAGKIVPLGTVGYQNGGLSIGITCKYRGRLDYRCQALRNSR